MHRPQTKYADDFHNYVEATAGGRNISQYTSLIEPIKFGKQVIYHRGTVMHIFACLSTILKMH